MTGNVAADCGCRVRTDVLARVGGTFTTHQLDRIVTAVHERVSGCAPPAEPADDRLILWALVHTGAFQAEIGEPRMRDELDSRTLATAHELEARVRPVRERVQERGHPGAVGR